MESTEMWKEAIKNHNKAAEKTGLTIKIQNHIHGSSKRLTNTKTCSVVEQEFERVRDCKYFAPILTEGDVN
jgi:hypothetical protein